MSTETDHLASWFAITSGLSLTVTSAQRPRSGPGPGARWEAGLTSYGWCNLGGRQQSGGAVTGLVFDSQVWFSDRVVDRGLTPTIWQQFSGAARDRVVFNFSINGDHVRLHADLIRWGSSWDADSFGYDAVSEQLLFHVPGAGVGAPPAVMMTSFGPGAPFL